VGGAHLPHLLRRDRGEVEVPEDLPHPEVGVNGASMKLVERLAVATVVARKGIAGTTGTTDTTGIAESWSEPATSPDA